MNPEDHKVSDRTTTQEALKEAVAKAALTYVQEKTIVGVGSGSTIRYFIDYLSTIRHQIEGTVASSVATATLLKQHHLPVFDLNAVSEVAVYIDSADACTPHLHLTKGGGAALTREKILACAAQKFICILDHTKWVTVLGGFPIPIEVIPMARSFVAREIVKLGGHPVYREGCLTDNGGVIIDVHHWNILEPWTLEKTLNNIPGIIGHGIFADRVPDVVLVATPSEIKKYERAQKY